MIKDQHRGGGGGGGGAGGSTSTSLPMHYATYSMKNICGFQTVFEVGLKYFPVQIGFVFHKNEIGHTPFQLACDQYGESTVEKIIYNGLDTIFVQDEVEQKQNKNNSNNNRLLKALINGVIHETIDLDCVYILLRIEPVVLLLRSTTTQKITQHLIGRNGRGRIHYVYISIR
jgi:hypothetical protein